jgi:hypothetical protein
MYFVGNKGHHQLIYLELNLRITGGKVGGKETTKKTKT